MRCSPCHSRRSFLVILYLDLYLGMYFIVLRGASRPLVAATDFLRFKLDFSFHYSPQSGGKGRGSPLTQQLEGPRTANCNGHYVPVKRQGSCAKKTSIYRIKALKG